MPGRLAYLGSAIVVEAAALERKMAGDDAITVLFTSFAPFFIKTSTPCVGIQLSVFH